MTKKKDPKDLIPKGRPETITPEIADRFMALFKMGLNDEESCTQLDIAPSVLYAYQNRHPDFLEKKRLSKSNLVGRARRELFNGLISDDARIRVETAKWILERKAKDEFSTKQELTGSVITEKIFISPEEKEEALKHISQVVSDGGNQ